jgi:dUTP pyrophosphatase
VVVSLVSHFIPASDDSGVGSYQSLVSAMLSASGFMSFGSILHASDTRLASESERSYLLARLRDFGLDCIYHEDGSFLALADVAAMGMLRSQDDQEEGLQEDVTSSEDSVSGPFDVPVLIDCSDPDVPAVFPAYEDDGSSGMDLRAVISVDARDGKGDNGINYIDIPAHSRRLIGTGLRVACPAGYELQVRPRSGLALKHGITVLNTPGTVDSSYRGEIGILLFNSSDESFRVVAGDRIAQLVLAPVARCIWHPVLSLPSSERMDGGFGHTGIK